MNVARSRRLRLLAPLLAVGLLAGAGCSASGAADSTSAPATTVTTAVESAAVESTATDSTDSSEITETTAETTEASASTSELFDSTSVHSVSITFDQADYDAMIAAYLESEDKEWIEGTVTIDGVTYENVGLRLKGNSTLRGLSGNGGGPGGDVSADEPEGLPWLIKLDKFVEGQEHDGLTEFVIRANSSETSLNEAVALQLLEEAGLASQDASAVTFSVNGSDAILRLAIEHPDDEWMDDTLGSDGALYKAESTGDYSYRGDDPESYDEVFDQEAGKDVTDLTPLIEFLDFINNSDDATFAAELEQHLDIDAFATYLAMQEVVQNFDDIDGPGNNSYLYWDAETGVMTVVPWDYNLAFGGGGFGGGFGGGGGMTPPGGDDATRPTPPAGVGGGGAGRGGGMNRSNVLVERFLAVDEFDALYEAKLAELTETLIDSGRASEILAEWVAVIERDASDVVDSATLTSEAEALESSF